jgi:hypothetical protein
MAVHSSHSARLAARYSSMHIPYEIPLPILPLRLGQASA